MFSKCHHIFAFFLLVSAFAFGQGPAANIYGKVRSSIDNRPVEFATVMVSVLGDTVAAPVGTLTDNAGNYSLDGLPVGKALLFRVSFSGMSSYYDTLTLVAGTRLCLDCMLAPASTQLHTVTVTDERSRTRSLTHIDVQPIDNNVGPNSGVESIIKTLPDVASNNEMSSQYSVRGGSFDENLVYINDVEIYRPSLIRSGQQEGMSIVNSDMVHHLFFSPGGFEAVYGDRMSSVLDITYARPTENRARLSASFLGFTAHAQGLAGKEQRFSYSVGFRQHSNNYIFRSLDTRGTYNTSYTDLQTVLGYRISDRLDISFLGLASRNIYKLVPIDQTTKFGNFMQTFELRVYFDGQEVDSYNTALGAVTLDYHPSDFFHLRWITSLQSNRENELYDIQSQYWLYELGLGETVGETEEFDRGVGTFLEHARNHLNTGIYSTEVKAVRYAALGNWNFGLRLQHERINDRVREWKWVDSAGYAIPTVHVTPGDSTNMPYSPVLQFFCSAVNSIHTTRLQGYVQRELNYRTDGGADWTFIAGARAHAYTTVDEVNGLTQSRLLFTPRLIASLKPSTANDILFRLAAGIYSQPPFYREMRLADGALNVSVKPQQSYQTVATCDWDFHLLDKPFKFTTDVYFKYLTHLVPYTIDNLRVRYDASREAVGYTTGVSLRLNGEFVPQLESWVSLSFMTSQQDIIGDDYGWMARPTNQRVAFKMFLQDNLPDMPWWCMSLQLIAAAGMPFTYPFQTDFSRDYYLPAYFRVDWGNTLRLRSIRRIADARIFRHVDDIQLSLEVFNLFNYKNVVSYLWVSDYDNVYYGVPNFLTARQLNLKLTVSF